MFGTARGRRSHSTQEVGNLPCQANLNSLATSTAKRGSISGVHATRSHRTPGFRPRLRPGSRVDQPPASDDFRREPARTPVAAAPQFSRTPAYRGRSRRAICVRPKIDVLADLLRGKVLAGAASPICPPASVSRRSSTFRTPATAARGGGSATDDSFNLQRSHARGDEVPLCPYSAQVKWIDLWAATLRRPYWR